MNVSWRVGLHQICQHSLKYDSWVYYASVMLTYWAKIKSILSDKTVDAYKIHCTVLKDSIRSNRTFIMY